MNRVLLGSMATFSFLAMKHGVETNVNVKSLPKKPNVLRVMIIDSGLDGNNPALRKYVPKRYLESRHAEDWHGHGTHVAGIVASGACPGVEILPCWYYNRDGGFGNLEREVGCLDLAIKENVDIINLSGGGIFSSSSEKDKMMEFLEGNRARVFVTSAGNDGVDLDKKPYYPCSYRLTGEVCVAAINRFGKLLPSSNYASWTVMEPGLMILSYLPDGKKGTMSGTSQAAAIHTAKLIRSWCNNANLR